jgi:hypothetical protein
MKNKTPIRMAFSWSTTTAQPGRLFCWLILLLGGVVIVMAVAGLWNGLQYFLYGVPASGRVIEFHHPMAHNMGVVAQVDVTLPGTASFRETIQDNLSTEGWEVGVTTLPLRCVRDQAGYFNCIFDSGLDRFLFPLIVLAVGAGMVWWSVKKTRGVPLR